METERKANQPVNAESSEDDIRDRARELYQKDGECEIDDDADVSRGGEPDPGPGDEGVYVQAWVWVPFEEEEEEGLSAEERAIVDAPGDTCSECGENVDEIIGCPDGAEICQRCFDKGLH